jgi:translation initiation factor 2 gamma subunit (eIF-2gamma)
LAESAASTVASLLWTVNAARVESSVRNLRAAAIKVFLEKPIVAAQAYKK